MGESPIFTIGIDLGTTNCALATAPLSEEQAAPQPYEIPQVLNPGEVGSLLLLPSFLYLPSPVEIPPRALTLPWHQEDHETSSAVGVMARDRGAATPTRLVSSAKSWLSFAGVDRRADILPWAAPDEVPKLSPVEVSARYLEHMRDAWDAAHPHAPLAEQDVVLTVPASFDAVARELTVEAAARAGLSDGLILLEEPQAALYSWLSDRGPAWRDELGVGDVILVCDLGGGTTDFSLIAVRGEEGALELERIAVGEHLLVGGDNMDLAMAYTVRARLEAQGTRIDDWQMRALTQSCRVAKEALLEDTARDRFPVTIPGRSSRLIGGTIRAEVERQELEAVLLDGFFPRVPSSARPQRPRRAGLSTMGLPYASDAGITRHLAAFLGRDSLERRPGASLVHPTAILFNGGVTRSPVIRQRLLSVLTSWLESEDGRAPKVLEGADPDQAVSRGAAYYAQVRRRGGMRIRGGTAQAYYIGVERAALAVPGIPPRVDALCVAPFGMEEGSEAELEEAFGLYVGEPVSFRFFGSSSRRGDDVGSVAAPEDLTELAPIETTFEGEGQLAGLVQVRLHARVTEVGTLELSALEQTTHRRWQLSYNVRVE